MASGIQEGNKSATGYRVVGHGNPYFWEFMDTFRPSNDLIPLSTNRLSLGKRSEYIFFHLKISYHIKIDLSFLGAK
jgi:hypothetical protein